MNPTLFILFVICASAIDVFANEGLKELKKIKDECIKEAGVDSKAVDEVFRRRTEITDEKVKCVLTCVAEKRGYVVNGDIDREKFKVGELPSFVPEDQKAELRERLIKCADITGANICDTTYLMTRCLMKD